MNIGGLFIDKKSDPIILSGKSGIYKVELSAGNNKEEWVSDFLITHILLASSLDLASIIQYLHL